LFYDYVYIQSMSMIRDHRLYIAYTCDYKAILHNVAFIKWISIHYIMGNIGLHFGILYCCFLSVLYAKSGYEEEEYQDYSNP